MNRLLQRAMEDLISTHKLNCGVLPKKKVTAPDIFEKKGEFSPLNRYPVQILLDLVVE